MLFHFRVTTDLLASHIDTVAGLEPLSNAGVVRPGTGRHSTTARTCKAATEGLKTMISDGAEVELGLYGNSCPSRTLGDDPAKVEVQQSFGHHAPVYTGNTLHVVYVGLWPLHCCSIFVGACILKSPADWLTRSHRRSHTIGMVSYARLTAMPEPSDCAILGVLLECATYIRGYNQPGAFGLSPSINITEDDKSSWVSLMKSPVWSIPTTQTLKS